MKVDNIKQATILIIMFAGCVCSCETNDDINMDDIDFSNIENLYEQPLPVIKKCVEGKWKHFVTYGGVAGITYHDNIFVDIKSDHIVIDKEDGSQQIFSYTWKKRTVLLMSGVKAKRWVICENEQGLGVWYFDSIQNDTLGVGIVPPPDVTFWQFSNAFERVK